MPIKAKLFHLFTFSPALYYPLIELKFIELRFFQKSKSFRYFSRTENLLFKVLFRSFIKNYVNKRC